MIPEQEQNPTLQHPTPESVDFPAAPEHDMLDDRTALASRSRIVFYILAIALGLFSILWVYLDELVHSSVAVGNAVPPIPALGAILILVCGAYLAYRIAHKSLIGRSHILLIYIGITVAAALASRASLVFFFGAVTSPQYLAATQPEMKQVASYFPSWLALPQGEAVRHFYEGSRSGAIPWNVWAVPLLAWGSFLFVLMLVLYALLALLRRSWMEEERLAYPIVQIPLRLVGSGSGPSIWRNPLLWIGFGLSSAFDGMNMLHAFYPSVPSMGVYFDIGTLFANRPWSVLTPLWISFRPEIFGIAYLMPTDVLLTTWVTYLSLCFSDVARAAMGAQVERTAYDYQEIGMGAFLCMFVILMKRAMPTIRRTWAEAVRRERRDRDEPFSALSLWLILILGTLFMVVWLYAAGLSLWIAVAHLTLLIAVAIVYARVRAETGAPGIYLFPFWQQQNMLFNFFGSEGVGGGSARALTVFASLGGLSRGYYPEVSAYGTEGMSLAAKARFPQRRVTTAVLAGLLLGLVFGGYMYLHAGYRYGLSQLPGNYQLSLVTQQYTTLTQMLSTPKRPQPDLIFQTCLGGILALTLSFLRQRLFWFPFHPIGFALASAYGFHLWAPFLIVWTAKVLILRLGGDRTYRRLVPLFLGFALGRYLFAGIVWGLLGMTGNPAVESYEIHFG
jgi:hypothetical protein